MELGFEGRLLESLLFWPWPVSDRTQLNRNIYKKCSLPTASSYCLTRLLERQEEGGSEMPCDLHTAIQVCKGITSPVASRALCAMAHPPWGSAIIRPISQMGRTSLGVIQCPTLVCTTAEEVGTLSSWLPDPAPSLPPCSSHCVLEIGPESPHVDPTITLGWG